MSDLAAIASERTGRNIKRVTISDDEWRNTKIAQGVPARMATMLLGMYVAARRGDFATVDPKLETLLGRRPQTMRDVLAKLDNHQVINANGPKGRVRAGLQIHPPSAPLLVAGTSGLAACCEGPDRDRRSSP